MAVGMDVQAAWEKAFFGVAAERPVRRNWAVLCLSSRGHSLTGCVDMRVCVFAHP